MREKTELNEVKLKFKNWFGERKIWIYKEIDKTITWRPQDKKSLKTRQVRLCLCNLIFGAIEWPLLQRKHNTFCVLLSYISLSKIWNYWAMSNSAFMANWYFLQIFSYNVLNIFSGFNQIWSFSRGVYKFPHVKCYGNPYSWKPVGSCGQTNRQKGIRKLTDHSHG
jgi:hypothetical protein